MAVARRGVGEAARRGGRVQSMIAYFRRVFIHVDRQQPQPARPRSPGKSTVLCLRGTPFGHGGRVAPPGGLARKFPSLIPTRPCVQHFPQFRRVCQVGGTHWRGAPRPTAGFRPRWGSCAKIPRGGPVGKRCCGPALARFRIGFGRTRGGRGQGSRRPCPMVLDFQNRLAAAKGKS